jgi:hypothetical protein
MTRGHCGTRCHWEVLLPPTPDIQASSPPLQSILSVKSPPSGKVQSSWGDGGICLLLLGPPYS